MNELLMQAVDVWLKYWGNQPVSQATMGLTSRISHGLVDIYLLDGRLKRDKDNGVCFGEDIINWLLQTIDRRGAGNPRVVVLSYWSYLAP